MIAPTAFRMAGRRLATSSSRRVFSAAAATTSANVAKHENARMAWMVTAAGLSLAVATLQQREVRSLRSIESTRTISYLFHNNLLNSLVSVLYCCCTL